MKNLFWENFSEILCKPRLSSTKTCEIWPYFLQFYSGFVLRRKNSHKYFPVVCTQVRRHVHKQFTKWRYGEENPRRFVFGKPILFALGLGLGILVWNFYQTFVTVSVEFWLRFEPQIRPTTLAINFLFITARDERRIRLCAKLFDFFVGEYSSVWPEICRVLSQIQWRFLRGISGKNYFGRIFQKFCDNQDDTKTCEIWTHFLQFYSGSVLRRKNSHKYFPMLFAPR